MSIRLICQMHDSNTADHETPEYIDWKGSKDRARVSEREPLELSDARDGVRTRRV